MTASKYKNLDLFAFPDRNWPNRTLDSAPLWCSADLRDGNQALPDPMTPDQKLEYFQLLCQLGFKQIEVGFPSASQDDFNFFRRLIEEKHIPEDVFVKNVFSKNRRWNSNNNRNNGNPNYKQETINNLFFHETLFNRIVKMKFLSNFK